MVLQDQDRWANDSVLYSSVSAQHRRSLRVGPASSGLTPRCDCFLCRYCMRAGERNGDPAQNCGVRLGEEGEVGWSLASAAEVPHGAAVGSLRALGQALSTIALVQPFQWLERMSQSNGSHSSVST